MSVSTLRGCLCWALSVLFPVALMAADTGSAVLRSTGGVWLNGTEVGGMVAIFSGDLLETKPGAVANVDADGSSVLIRAESVVKFNGDSLTLEHGIVSVGTSKGMSVHVDCIRVEPVLHEWTQYDVTNVSGTVQVAARKNDVNIHQGVSMRKVSPQGAATQSVTVHEGQEATRNTADACGVARRPGAGGGGNPKWVEIGVGTGGGILILCLLLCKGPPEQPVSNSQP